MLDPGIRAAKRLRPHGPDPDPKHWFRFADLFDLTHVGTPVFPVRRSWAGVVVVSLPLALLLL